MSCDDTNCDDTSCDDMKGTRVSARTHGRERGRGLRATAVAATLVVAAGVSACSPREAGAAAVLDNRRVSLSQVTQAVQGIKVGNPELAQGEGLDRTVLFFLVLAPYVLSEAQQAGVGASEDEARALLPKAPDPDPNAVRVLRTFLALQKLQQAGKTDALGRIQADLKSSGVRLNPRFGRLDTSTLQIVDRTPNWLVPVQSAATGQPGAPGQPTQPSTPPATP